MFVIVNYYYFPTIEQQSLKNFRLIINFPIFIYRYLFHECNFIKIKILNFDNIYGRERLTDFPTRI